MTANRGIRALILFTLAAAAPAFAGEGFGGLSKAIVTLMRTSPPEASLPGTRIAVRAGQSRHADLTSRLASSVETRLLANDKRLSASSDNPEVVIQVAVSESSGDTQWQSHSYQVKSKSGGTQTVTERTLVVRHKLAVNYSAARAKGGATVDSAAFDIPYEKAFADGDGAPSLERVASDALDEVARRIAARLTFTREPVQVLLPRGSLDRVKALAQAGAWNKYLEALEAMPAKPDGRDEAYRQFALGIAHEALAYAADNPEVALNYLEQASLQYNKAIELKPDEKYFLKGFTGDFIGGLLKDSGLLKDKDAVTDAVPPLDRIQTATVKYQKVKELQAPSRNALASAPAAGGKSLERDARPGALDNGGVLAMVEAGLDEDVILTAIKTAASTTFDVSSNGLIQLSKGGVSGKLLRQIQAAANGAAPAGARKAAPAKP